MQAAAAAGRARPAGAPTIVRLAPGRAGGHALHNKHNPPPWSTGPDNRVEAIHTAHQNQLPPGQILTACQQKRVAPCFPAKTSARLQAVLPQLLVRSAPPRPGGHALHTTLALMRGQRFLASSVDHAPNRGHNTRPTRNCMPAHIPRFPPNESAPRLQAVLPELLVRLAPPRAGGHALHTTLRPGQRAPTNRAETGHTARRTGPQQQAKSESKPFLFPAKAPARLQAVLPELLVRLALAGASVARHRQRQRARQRGAEAVAGRARHRADRLRAGGVAGGKGRLLVGSKTRGEGGGDGRPRSAAALRSAASTQPTSRGRSLPLSRMPLPGKNSQSNAPKNPAARLHVDPRLRGLAAGPQLRQQRLGGVAQQRVAQVGRQAGWN
jgi:hypothetical protein